MWASLPCGWHWGWQQESEEWPDSLWVCSSPQPKSWLLAPKCWLWRPALWAETDSDEKAHPWFPHMQANGHSHALQGRHSLRRMNTSFIECTFNEDLKIDSWRALIVFSSDLSSVHTGILPCGVCVGKVSRSLLLRWCWCCGIFSGESCCRSDSSSRSYMSLCSSKAILFSSRYCFSNTWATFCMGSA